MKDDSKTKKQLINELIELRRQLSSQKISADEFQQLRDDNEKFLKAFMQSSLPMTLTTIEEGRFIDVNEAFLRLTECKRNEIIGNTPTGSGYITAEQRAIFFNELNRNGRVDNHEMPVKTKAGEVRFGLFNAVMMTIKKEKYLLTVLTDITERRKADTALRESEDKYRSLFQNAPTGIFHSLPEGKFLQVNPALSRMFGYESPEEMIAAIANISTQIYIDSKKRSDLLALTMGSDDWVYAENRYRHKDGTILTANLSVRKILKPDGTVAYLEGFVEDITERKRAEAALKESEERYRTLVENAGDIVFRLDTTGHITFVNPAGLRITGYEEREIIGRHYPTFIRKDRQEEAIKFFGRQFVKGIPNSYSEYPIIAKDGREVWLEQNTQLIFQDGKVVAFQAVSRDITDRKHAQEALRESELRYRLLADNMKDTIWLMDLNLMPTYCSPSVEKARGFTVEEIKQLSLSQHLTPQSLQLAMEVFAEEISKVSADPTYLPKRTLELEFYLKDGTTGLTESTFSLIRDNGGNPQSILCEGRDITERKQAEEKLRESEEKFRQLVTMAQVAIFTEDLEGIVTYANPATKNIMGGVDIVGMSTSDLIAPEVKSVHNAMMESRRQGDSDNRSYEWPLILPKDGSIRFVDIRSTLLMDQSRPSGILLMASDITSRKQSEAEKAQLEAQNRQLQKSESLSRMAGAIAHHFNNKLAVVMGNLELAMDELPQGAKPVKTLNAAMQAASRAAEMSSLMLTYLGQTPGKQEPLDVSQICLQNVPLLRTVMPGKVVMETALPSPGPIISANANQIQQIITTLVTNALESMGDDKGTINLSVKTVAPAEIPVVHRYPAVWQPKDKFYACLEVKDKGCGIVDKDMEKLFDPFFSTKFTGRGMGLPVVMGIVNAHGGAITVESKPGKGSTFRVFFPLSAKAVVRQPDKTDLPTAIKGGGTVLLVEDEEMVRNMAAAMLLRLGFSVMEAKDGVEALEVFRQHQDEIRFVLSDLTLPRMNGWETLTALRQLKPGIPVILTSGYDKARVMTGDHPELPQAFLGKPYRLQGLSDAISQALG